MLKWLDIPPIWLVLFLITAWLVSPGAAGGGVVLLGGALVAVGLGLILWAAVTMVRSNTTVVPHLRAATLVTKGPFRFSRNPIYLGDALVLSGCLLRWGLWWALPLVFLFMWLITVRFIRSEEVRLREDFGLDFETWCAKTRRWL
ncbi:MAG: isoprenylcysteine carboxylmethyltransferase family protein [Pseudomonadota bacterium]